MIAKQPGHPPGSTPYRITEVITLIQLEERIHPDITIMASQLHGVPLNALHDGITSPRLTISEGKIYGIGAAERHMAFDIFPESRVPE